MNLENLKEIIHDVEQRFAVNEWEIDGIKLWPFIRIENYMLLSYKALDSKPLQTKSYKYGLKIIISKINYLKARIFDQNNEAQYNEKDIVFLSDGMAFTKLKTKWYNKLCDPLASEFKNRGFTSIRLDLSHNFFTPRHSPSKFIQPKIDNIIIKALFKNKIVNPKFSNEKWYDFENFITDKKVRENFIYIPSKDTIRKRIDKIKKIKLYYSNILKTIKPKIGFIVNYYGDDQMAFTLACNELNIPTVDIQHGVQGEFHLSYGNWFKIPPTGYTQIPNYFWVWSQEEKKNIDEWCFSTDIHKVIIGGNLFSEIWKDNASEIVIDFDKQFNRLKKIKEKKSVLITLSPHTESLMIETWETLKIYQNNYNWFIRVHPSMINEIKNIKEKLLKMGITKFEIKESSMLPLQTILRNVDAHITCQSSCVIEATDFGIKSLITSDYGKSLYEDQIYSQKAFFVKTVEEIINSIEIIVNNKKDTIFNYTTNLKNNSIENLINSYLKNPL